MNLKSLRIITTIALLLALFVIMLGAYTRLTDAGLGCPDWPGCYGRMILPSAEKQLSHAQLQYPQIPIESGKAWTEMAHRYAAGTLVFFIALIFFQARKVTQRKIPQSIPFLLLGLIVFQALLGMWTVTLKLLPVVVMGHLLGGSLIFASLCYFRWQISDVKHQPDRNWRAWIGLGVIIVFIQIALGGWVSSNYAGIACIGFPLCNGQWIPPLHFSEGFYLLSPVGENYQGGLLENDIRATIQFIHRIWAVVTAFYIFVLATVLLIWSNHQLVKQLSIVAGIMVCVQFMLGIINVVYLLPLFSAVAHNGGAVILLGIMVSLFYVAKKEGIHASHP